MKHLVKRLTGSMLCIILAVGMLPIAGRKAKAAESGNTAFDIRDDIVIIVRDENGTTVNGNAYEGNEIVIKGDKDTAVDNFIRIKVGENLAVTVVLRNVNIDMSAVLAAVLIQGAGSVTIKLEGENTVKSGADSAGIQKESTGKLIISETENKGSITAIGGYYAAGIGGGFEGSVADITIVSGTVTANGGEAAAGIGGGYCGSSSDITIIGGTVTANGGDNGGAGIGGGGRKGSGSHISIGGKAEVIAEGGTSGAGIGGGEGGSGTYITIYGGTVTANGGDYGAGIGGGHNGEGSDITVTDGTVTAEGGEFGAGIGGGMYYGDGGSGKNISITGGTVTAEGGGFGAGIGGGDSGDGFNITISGGTVNAIGGMLGAGIGGGFKCSGSDITIGGEAEVIARGGEDGAGIGGGFQGNGSNITITGDAVVKASGGINNSFSGVAIGQGTQWDEASSKYYAGAESIITTITKESSGLDGQVWRYPAGTSAEKMAEDVENKMDGAEQVEVATITFDANGGQGTTFTDEITPGGKMTANSFTREGFVFTGWNTETGGTGTSYSNEEIVTFIGKITLYAQWTKLYNVTVKNGKATDKNNKEITQAIKGATVTVTAATLDEGQAFIEWSCDDKTVTFAKTDSFETTFVMPEGEVNVEAVIRDITITDLEESYTYTAAEIKPNVTVGFEGVDIDLQNNKDYELSYKDNVKPGTASVTVTINKPRAGSKTVTFKITGNTVRWLDGDGSVLEEAYYTTDMPSYSKGITPTRKDVTGHKYTFKGWIIDKVDKNEYGDVTTYIPEFYDEVIEYNVTFVDADGTILQSGKVAYGDLPAYSKTPAGTTGASCPAKFTGWEPAITNVTGDAIYTATYGEHVYNQEVVDAKYLKSPADCITAAVYYKSCACGEKSTDEKDIFTSGEPAGHKWKAATGYAPKTCEVCGLEEGQKVTYDPIKGQVFVWTKGSKEPFVLTIKRSQDDVNCFLHYLNTLLDGAEIKVEAKSGSTIITIPAETLEKLSVGEHKITVVFDDWKADFALSIAEAVATPTPAVDATPVTGDTMPVVPVVVVMVAAMAIAFAVRKKKQSAE